MQIIIIIGHDSGSAKWINSKFRLLEVFWRKEELDYFGQEGGGMGRKDNLFLLIIIGGGRRGHNLLKSWIGQLI